MKVFYDDKRHLVCTPYTVSMLHQAAKMLGLNRCWFHASPYPHYDLPKRWTAERLRTLDVNGVEHEQVTPRRLLMVIKEGLHVSR